MKFIEDPRIKEARKSLFIAWLFFFIYIFSVMLFSYILKMKQYIFGLPQWVAIGNIVIPAIFVILLIPVVEKFIKNISLTDDKNNSEIK